MPKQKDASEEREKLELDKESGGRQLEQTFPASDPRVTPKPDSDNEEQEIG